MHKKRPNNGHSIAELPAAIMLLLIGFAIPIIIFASLFYKIYMFHCIVKNGAIVGANQQDIPTAKTSANNYMAAGNTYGVTVTTPATVTLVTRNVAYTPTSGTKTNYTTYYLQVAAQGSIAPLLAMGSFFGTTGIPGLTGPIQMTTTESVYFENQQAAQAFAGGP